MKLSKTIKLIFTLIVFSSQVYAQNTKTGIIRGSVKDKNTGEAIIGANIVIDGTTTGTATDANGNYKLSVAVGTYTLKVSFLGYKTFTKYNIVVNTGNDQIVNFELEEEGNDLDEIVVKFDQNRSAAAADMITPMSTQKITTEEIKSNPGGNFDVSRVIQVLPGVGGGTQANRNDIIVRGGAPNENVYYLDGIEIPVLNHFQTQGASGGATGILNVSFIEDVQLSSSAFDARYDNALASTFNIKQRTGNPEKIGGNLRLSGTEFATTLEGPLSSKTTFLASARRSYLQFLFQLLDLPIRPDYWDFQYKITHKIDVKSTLNFIGVGAIDRFRLVAPENTTPENEYILRSNPLLDQWNYTFGVSYNRLINNGFLNIALSRNMLDNSADQFEDNIENELKRTLRLRSQEIENKLRVDVNKFINGWKFSYGIMAQYVKFNVNLFNTIANQQLDSNGNIISPRVNINYNSAIDFFKYGAFGQVSKRFISNRLLLSFGIRTDMNSFTTNGNNPIETLSPRFSFSYTFAPKLDITGSVGRYFKIPIYTNLGFRNEFNELVNRDMKYIQSDHIALGFQFLPKESTRLTVEGFYKFYSNYPVSVRTGISQANQGAQFTSVGNEEVVSIGKGETYGVEIFYQQKLVKNLFYTASATVYRSLFSGRDGKLIASSWDFGYLVSATLGRKFKGGWEMGLKYRLAGGAPYTPFDPILSRRNYLISGAGTLDFDQLNTVRLLPFNQFDFRLDKKVNFKKVTLDLFIDIQNALLLPTPGNPTYTWKRNATNTGFETTDGQAIKSDGSNAIPVLLQDNTPTVVPTIGFILEF